MAILSVREAFAVDDDGGVTRVFHRGDLVDSSDPVVKGREVLFDPVESTVRPAPATVEAATVEAATAEPGVKRTRAKVIEQR